MTDCVFCRIISGSAPAKRIYEDAEVLVIEDLHPRAHYHYLVIPKEHVASLLEVEDAVKLGRWLWTAKQIAESCGFAQEGFRVVINTGHGGGQSIDHFHIHILGGKVLPYSLHEVG